MDLEGVMLSKRSQRKTSTVWYHLLKILNLKKKTQLVDIIKKKQTHRYGGLVVASGEREKGGLRGTN